MGIKDSLISAFYSVNERRLQKFPLAGVAVLL